MYSSLVGWCRFPTYIKVRTGTSAGGDPTFAEGSVKAMGYIAEIVELITDKFGKEYASNSRVYFPPTVTITVDDKISLHTSDDFREIRLHRKYYDGETGKASIQVVYL